MLAHGTPPQISLATHNTIEGNYVFNPSKIILGAFANLKHLK